MPYRANSFAPALVAGSLAAGVFFGLICAAFAAEECLESPDQRTTRAGHWYYHYDRVNHRRCWFFQPSEATAGAPASAEPAPAAATNADPQQSWVSRMFGTPAVAPQPQQLLQNNIPESSGETPQTAPARPARTSKIAKRDRPPIAPPPTTSGAASIEQPDQPPPQPVAEKTENRTLPLNVADREALFQDFLKWQMRRSMFGNW